MSFDLTGATHHPALEEITDLLAKETENNDRAFFRPTIAYFFARMASHMRATVTTKSRADIPVNLYVISTAVSGYGKGKSVSFMESRLEKGFKRQFLGHTLPVKTEESFWRIANDRAVQNNSDQQEEYEKVKAEDGRTGPFVYNFAQGSAEGVKQMRHKMLLAEAGSLNFQVDEIGSNLDKVLELLTVYLELYEDGEVKAKLIKNSSDNKRDQEMDGKSPANMLLFGTPAKLLDGSNIEKTFYELLETGYARRCLFACGDMTQRGTTEMTAEEKYFASIDPQNSAMVTKWAAIFTGLADPARFGWKILVEDDVAIRLKTYQMDCERRANLMKDHEGIPKAELEHRHAKALKLAGAFAFVDGSNEIEMDHLMSAILLVEESGESFQKIITREPKWVRLGQYIADVGKEVNHHSLLTALPYYPKSQSDRTAMMNLAMSWGHENNVIIKKTFRDGIEFFKGETLKKTDLNAIRLSYSDNFAYEYEPVEVPFADLAGTLCIASQADEQGNPTGEPVNWANHHFRNGHRADENVIPGFNMLVIDIDGGVSLDLVGDLLRDTVHLAYTTKRSTSEAPRLRLLIPTNYILELDKKDYREMATDVISWLPFNGSGVDIDGASLQPSKKWLTNPSPGCQVRCNLEGELLDILPFIPKTKKNEDYRQGIQAVENMDNLERWFAQRMAEGNRNNHMIKFALALVDSGMDLISVSRAVHEFNKKLSNPLSEVELDSSIMVTVAKRIQKKAA